MSKLKQYSTDILLSVFLVTVLILAYLPADMEMSDSVRMSMLAIFAIVVTVFLLLFWKEKPRDERESYHSLYSGKVAYTVGVVLLSVANIYQVLNHSIDIWLPITLAVMVITKFLTRFFLESKN